MSTTTKKELVDRIAQNTQAKHALVKATVQGFLDEIISELAKGNRLEFRDFGVFQVRERPARTAQNPKTLEKVQDVQHSEDFFLKIQKFLVLFHYPIMLLEKLVPKIKQA